MLGTERVIVFSQLAVKGLKTIKPHFSSDYFVVSANRILCLTRW
jgi:hypothetical protein